MPDTVATIFLILHFCVIEGRIAIIKNDCVIMVVTHRVVRERVAEDVEIVQVILDHRQRPGESDEIVRSVYKPRSGGQSNHELLEGLAERGWPDRILIGRLHYADFKLVRLEFWDRDR